MRDRIVRYGLRLGSELTSRLVRRQTATRFPDATIESGVLFRGPLSNLSLGEGTNLQSGCVVHLGGMEWCEFAGQVSIGRNGVVSPHAVIYGCGPGGVTIGE